MKMFTKRVLSAVAVGLIVIAAGCHHFTGGGWLAGLYGGKAHFGFNMKCKETGEAGPEFPWVFWDGQMQYMDKSAGVRFHGEFVWTVAVHESFENCEEAADYLESYYGGSGSEAFYASGQCRTQPGNVPGYFEVYYVFDGGTPGSAGDWIEVMTDCTADGSFYANGGPLLGGNIRSHGH